MSTIKEDADHSLINRAYAAGLSRPETVNLYDEWADNYERDLKSTVYKGPSLIAKGLNNLDVAKDARILDAGCGTGLVGLELSLLGFGNIDGVDMSQLSLEKAREKGVYKKLLCAELGPEPLEGIDNNTYDVIVSAGCFCGESHLNDECLKEWTRIVKPGGHICIMITAMFLYLLEGETFKSLLEEKVIEVAKKYTEEDYTDYSPGYFYDLKVIRS
ncbi:methyltransferase-like protein 27 isoform X1 [Glandiceps talaboti]